MTSRVFTHFGGSIMLANFHLWLSCCYFYRCHDEDAMDAAVPACWLPCWPGSARLPVPGIQGTSRELREISSSSLAGLTHRYQGESLLRFLAVASSAFLEIPYQNGISLIILVLKRFNNIIICTFLFGSSSVDGWSLSIFWKILLDS